MVGEGVRKAYNLVDVLRLLVARHFAALFEQLLGLLGQVSFRGPGAYRMREWKQRAGRGAALASGSR